MKKVTKIYGRLYESPLEATRSGALFNAHAYPTKIDPTAIALAIACHTEPGQTVFDGFGGSGTTALAALLCSNPSAELRQRALDLGLKPKWGTRNAVVCEVSGLGSFVAETLTTRIDPRAFEAAAERILKVCAEKYGWLYHTVDDSGDSAEIRYTVWSDILECPSCDHQVPFWEACVSRSPAKIASEFRCPKCRKVQRVEDASRVEKRTYDDLLGKSSKGRLRRPAQVYGKTGTRTWSRDPQIEDEKLLQRIHETPLPRRVPLAAMRWGDLHRSGYHQGITHVHQFYTRRNLIAVAAVQELIEEAPATLRNALNFWLSSYNSSHSTLMTRVVAKQGSDELVVTSNQPGVLYISGLPVEKHVFQGLRRKLGTITRAFEQIATLDGSVRIIHGSSHATGLPDSCIDYIFTDPPFGGNIPYSEVNFISEAWLGRTTEQLDEAIVSPAQNKGLSQYERLLEQCFSECRRILKPDGFATLIFHSSEAAVWKSLMRSLESSGFSVDEANVLDKRQGSFKQVTTPNAVKGDALLLLRPGPSKPASMAGHYIEVMRELVAYAIGQTSAEEKSAQRLYARFIGQYTARQSSPPINADIFYAELAAHFVRHGQLGLFF